MNPSAVIESLKEFFFDVIGYLIPGFIALTLLFISLVNNYKTLIFAQTHVTKDYLPIFIIIISYIAGHIIYAIALLRDDIARAIRIKKIRNLFETNKDNDLVRVLKFLRIEIRADIENQIKETYEFKTTLSILKKVHKSPDIIIDPTEINNLSLSQARSLAMSYLKDDDKKIYGYMFRSELCNLTSVIFLIIALLGFTSKIIDWFSNRELIFFIKDSPQWLYISFLVASLFLNKTRLRFLRISLSVPFSIFLTKYFKLP